MKKAIETHFPELDRSQKEAAMLCEELERLEGQLDEIITALENPRLGAEEKKALEEAYAKLSHTITDHQILGHHGGPCFEE